MIVFPNKVATSYKYTQTYWMTKLGLTEKDQQRYKVDFDLYEKDQDKGGLVYIHDHGVYDPDQMVLTFEFSTNEAVKGFAAIMEQEVGNWDVEAFYENGDIQADAVHTYEAANSSFMRAY